MISIVDVIFAMYCILPMAAAAFVLDLFISHVAGGFGRKLIVTIAAFAVTHVLSMLWYSSPWWYLQTGMFLAAVVLFIGWIVLEAGFTRNG